MKNLKNIIVSDGMKEYHNQDILKNKNLKISQTLEKIISYLEQRGSSIIHDINKEQASIYISHPSGEWKVMNASSNLINRIFG